MKRGRIRVAATSPGQLEGRDVVVTLVMEDGTEAMVQGVTELFFSARRDHAHLAVVLKSFDVDVDLPLVQVEMRKGG